MRGIGARCLCLLQDILAAVRVTRAPLIVAIISFLALCLPAQVHELYLLMGRNWQGLWLQILLALGSLTGLSLIIMLLGRGLIRAGEDANATRSARAAPSIVLRALPSLLGALPPLGAALGLYWALQSTLTDPLRRAIAIFEAIKSPKALAETLRTIDLVPDVATKIQALFPDGWGPQHGKPDPETLAMLNQVVLENVPSTILQLPEKTQALSLAIYSGIVICVLLALLLLALPSHARAATALDGATRSRVFHPVALFVFFASFLSLTALFAAQSVTAGQDIGFDFTSIPRALGTLCLVNLCLISLVFLSSILTRASDRLMIPLLTPLLAIALLASLLDWNDNHAVRLVESSAADLANRKIPSLTQKVPPPADAAFQAWFASRPADYKKKFVDKPYPIYIVAAQGGGMYAANLSGLFLSRLYDRCPLIRHHVFAVSGVSGGSVGAGFFAALLNAPPQTPLADTCDVYLPADGKPHPKGPLEMKMEALLQSDFLAPVAASFLFPDLLQRFLPVPIPAFDRARAFEEGVERAWDAVVTSKGNPLRQPFWRHWRPDGDSPMLLLNTTIVESGRQVAAAPVELKPFSQETTPDLQSLQGALRFRPEIDVPLSTAMSLSARFPIVMPAGLVRSEDRTFHLVDGGYYENSAVDASLAVISQLRGALCNTAEAECVGKSSIFPGEPRTFRFKMFILTDYDPTPNYHSDPRKGGGGLNELLSPVRAMFNSRVARGEVTVGRTTRGTENWAGHVSLSHRIYNLPLGWQLSPQVQEVISAQVTPDCSYGKDGKNTSEWALQFIGAFSAISWIDGGLEIVDAEKHNRKPRTYTSTPLGQILITLKTNHCAVFQALTSDKVPQRLPGE
jgi:Patatin-like phospholipase